MPYLGAISIEGVVLDKILGRAFIIWGLLDLAFFTFYVTSSLWSGRVPIYSDMLSAWYNSKSLGSALPFVAACSGLLMYLSIPVSGVLLLRGHRFGVYIANVQFPFRVITVKPSLFFILWFAPLLPQQMAVVFGILFIITTEVLKLWSLRQQQAR